MTWRQVGEFWMEVKRVIGDKVKVTTCCCNVPGMGRKDCQKASGNKTPCRCHCHSEKE